MLRRRYPFSGSATGRCGSTSVKLDLKRQSAEHPSKILINSSVGNSGWLACSTAREESEQHVRRFGTETVALYSSMGHNLIALV